MLKAAGVMNTSVMCMTYMAGFKADPRSLIKLSVTSLVHEFEGAASRMAVIVALNGELNYSVILVSAVLITVLIIEPDWPQIPVLQTGPKWGMSSGLSLSQQ